MKAIKSLIFTGLLFSIVGCFASNNTKRNFKFEIIVGKTSQKKVAANFGLPNHVKETNNDSDVVWVYSNILRIFYKETTSNNHFGIY